MSQCMEVEWLASGLFLREVPGLSPIKVHNHDFILQVISWWVEKIDLNWDKKTTSLKYKMSMDCTHAKGSLNESHKNIH